MTFSRRLILFFVLIVVLPIVAGAVLLTQVAEEWRTGKADAALAASTQTAVTVFGDELDAAAADARAAGRDAELAAALQSEDERSAHEAAERLAAELDLAALAVETSSGQTLAQVGSRDPVASPEVVVRGPAGALGRVRASALDPDRYVAETRSLTGREVALFSGEELLAATIELGAAELPEQGSTADVELPDGDYRASMLAPDRANPSVRLAIFGPTGSGSLAASSPLVNVAVIAFVAVAVLCVVLLVRALQGQVREMFGAARRIGGGDFSHRVPVEGDDEMAGLAREFNTMSERLSGQMAELRRQRSELERSVKRIGEAFAAGLDRTALLEIVTETALAACGAGTARVTLTGRRKLKAEAGERPPAELAEALREAEQRALGDGAPVAVGRGRAHALAQPLPGLNGARRRGGVMAIGRLGAPFDSGQMEMLRYLAGQAAVSVGNIELHELVSDHTLTDELTGLSNDRRFRELIGGEVERAKRFGQEVSLVALEVDHLEAGGERRDEVLREVGRILEDEVRGVDEPARCGEAEFVISLHETGSDEALAFAEWIRARLEGARIARAGGQGSARVTASVGVATLSGRGGQAEDLIAAARAALDRAKGAGGNRTEAGPEAGEVPAPLGSPPEQGGGSSGQAKPR